ncbi:hypothetical protein KAR91_33145 [Candidatus Pacearchaeota archaeon]|nr:hypothetical protein [Candidatus Pacearchaeota archaeon]
MRVKVDCTLLGDPFIGNVTSQKKRVSTVVRESDGEEFSVYNKYITEIEEEAPIEDDEVGVRLHPDRSKYVRTKDGLNKVHLDIGDYVANELREMDIAEIYTLVIELGIPNAEDLPAKYINLNFGMQRMNLGNKIRYFMIDCGFENFNEAFKIAEGDNE